MLAIRMTRGSNVDARARDDSVDWTDVPATVVCAACGKPDCAGCCQEEPTHASGVIAIIPWERPQLGMFRRLWQTSFLATTQARAFFGSLSDGDVSPALAFALLCEGTAVLGLGLGAGVLALVCLPRLPSLLLADRVLRESVLRDASLGLVLLVFTMISLHLLHGLCLDFAARRSGSVKRGRGLRFGAYACGWDLITLPLGLLAVALIAGFSAAKRAAPLGLTAPRQSTEAYLVGVHALEPDAARLASKRAARLIVVPLLVILTGAAALFVAFAR